MRKKQKDSKIDDGTPRIGHKQIECLTKIGSLSLLLKLPQSGRNGIVKRPSSYDRIEREHEKSA